MKNLRRIAKIAEELENQLGIVNDIEEQENKDIENNEIPEPALEAEDDVVVSLEDANDVIVPENEEADDEITAEEMADVAVRVGKIAKKVRKARNLTASQKNAIIAKLCKIAGQKVADDNAEEDPKYLQIIAMLKKFSAKYNSLKTKKAGQLLGMTSLSGVTLEELFDALYRLASTVGHSN